MSVPSEISSITYVGNNSNVTAYPVPFTFYEASHLHVQVKVTLTGAVTTLLPTTGFIATDEGVSGGGSIRTVLAYPSGNTIFIARRVPLTQSVVLAEGIRLPLKVFEKALDWSTMQVQRVWQMVLQVAADLAAHIARRDNPHQVTKAQVGLGLVDNTADVDKPISTSQAAALLGKIPTSEKGAPYGVATLDSNGKISLSQIPAGFGYTLPESPDIAPNAFAYGDILFTYGDIPFTYT